jgi:hypothetical protein
LQFESLNSTLVCLQNITGYPWGLDSTVLEVHHGSINPIGRSTKNFMVHRLPQSYIAKLDWLDAHYTCDICCNLWQTYSFPNILTNAQHWQWPTWNSFIINIRVELPITKHVFIIKHFSIFRSFLNQIKQFLCHWMHKLEATNVLSVSEGKEQCKIWVIDCLLQFFLKK